MTKKILLGLLFSLGLVSHAFASTHDYSAMSPTVKVTSYKKLFTENVLAYGSGSATLISADGLMVTNHHVVFNEEESKLLDAFEVCITFDPKEEPVCEYTAQLVASDKDLDVGILKMDSRDVFGNPLPNLKFMDFRNAPAPKVGDPTRVIGYPASGGETVTSTLGQISGSESHNNVRYFKTDTDFDHGSSGGTVLDSQSRYIGIPTYLRTYAENVGFFLDLADARPWIERNMGQKATVDAKATEWLARDLAQLARANETLRYAQDHYPYLELSLPTGWQFEDMDHDSFYASQKNISDPLTVSVVVTPYPYALDDAYLVKLREDLEDYKKTYPDFKLDDSIFAGQKAIRAVFTSYDSKNTIYYIPYGATLVSVHSAILLSETARQEKDLKSVLEALKFGKSTELESKTVSSVHFEEPPFSLSVPQGWRIQKNQAKDPADLLAEALQKGNWEGSLQVSYRSISKDQQGLSDKELLTQKTDNLGNQRLIAKNDSVVLGGLPGFLTITEYEGDRYQEMRKRLTLRLKDNDFEFLLDYEDLASSFDQNLPDVQAMLDSFSFTGSTPKDKSIHSYGELGLAFQDIQFHPYAAAIADLADKGILTADAKGQFRPEEPMARAEALKVALESKNHLEKKKNSGKAVDFATYKTKAKLALKDLKANSPFRPYVGYSVDQKWLSGYADKTFRPNQPILLAEALKVLFGAYEIPLWKGESTPWTKKYMDKGFELGLIPRGFSRRDAGEPLTRAEFANLVYTLYKQADNSFSIGY